MDERAADKIIAATHWPRVMAACALGMLAIFLLVLTFGALKSNQYIGSGIQPTDTINVEGEGEVFAVPDTATFTVTVQETAPDVQTAQTKATNDINGITAYLKGQSIPDTDVQTSDYEINPQYEYSGGVCNPGGICTSGSQKLTGYQVSETLTVKVTDTSKAGTILAGVGGKGASSVSGLSLTVADEDVLQDQARDKAIQQAQGKAQDLAKSLGVSLVRIVNFSDNQNGGPVTYFAKASAGMAMDSAAVPAPAIPTGQNKITDEVTLTYEIR